MASSSAMIRLHYILLFFITTSSIYAGCAYTPPDTDGGGGSAGHMGTAGAGGIPLHRSVQCGMVACGGDQDCCLPMPPGAPYCVPRGGDCPSLRTECNGAEDCDNTKICCGTFDVGSGRYSAIRCESSCDTPRKMMCNTNAEAAPCPNPAACMQDPNLGMLGYGYCGFL